MPALIKPFLTVSPYNKLPNKKEPKMSDKKLQNIHLGSFVLFSVVLVTPSNKETQFSIDLTTLQMSFISAFDITSNVVSEKSIFFRILAYIP